VVPAPARRITRFAVSYRVEREAQAQMALLKPAEVAAKLAVSRTWLYDAAKSGRIPSIRIGGEDGPLRFVSEDLERWLDDARSSWLPGQPPVPPRHPVEPNEGLRLAS
jgi:excisionase family DNA binding protein